MSIINLNYSWSDLTSEYPPVGTTARPLSSYPFSYPRPHKRDNRRKGGKGLFVLADELFLYIFSFLDPIELINGSLVCQEFKRLINDDSLWRSLYHTYWKRDYAFRHCWREAVKQGMLSEENWMTGNHQKLVLRGAHTGPIACIQLNGDTVVSAGADAMLQVWNRRDGGKRVQLRGHTGEVQALELRGNRAISGSADSTIRVWSVYSKDCLKLLAGHQKSIECINVDDNHVVSGSADTTVKLWDLHTGQLMRTWRDHTGVITRVAIRDGGHTLVSASADGTPDSSFFCTWDESA